MGFQVVRGALLLGKAVLAFQPQPLPAAVVGGLIHHTGAGPC